MKNKICYSIMICAEKYPMIQKNIEKKDTEESYGGITWIINKIAVINSDNDIFSGAIICYANFGGIYSGVCLR